jgi:hypothetical protein
MYKVTHADFLTKRRLFDFRFVFFSFFACVPCLAKANLFTSSKLLQIFIALIIFDFYFLQGFLVQVVTLLINRTGPEFALSIDGIFGAPGAMCLAIYCALIESNFCTVAVVGFCLEYFCFAGQRSPGYLHRCCAVPRV